MPVGVFVNTTHPTNYTSGNRGDRFGRGVWASASSYQRERRAPRTAESALEISPLPRGRLLGMPGVVDSASYTQSPGSIAERVFASLSARSFLLENFTVRHFLSLGE